MNVEAATVCPQLPLIPDSRFKRINTRFEFLFATHSVLTCHQAALTTSLSKIPATRPSIIEVVTSKANSSLAIQDRQRRVPVTQGRVAFSPTLHPTLLLRRCLILSTVIRHWKHFLPITVARITQVTESSDPAGLTTITHYGRKTPHDLRFTDDTVSSHNGCPMVNQLPETQSCYGNSRMQICIHCRDFNTEHNTNSNTHQ